MKKFLALLLAFVMLFAMVGCEKDEKSAEKAEGSKTSGEKLPKFNKDATVEEAEIYSSEGVTITVKELVYEDYCAKLKLDVKNESSKTYNINSGYADSSVAVNGVTISYAGLYCEVGAGKTEEAEMMFYYDNLQMVGIDVLAKLDLGFEITDAEDYTDRTVTRAVLDTSKAESYEYDTAAYRTRLASSDNQKKRHYELKAASADVCYDQEGVKIVSQHVVQDESGGVYFLLEVENTSEELVVLGTQQMTINGLKIQNMYEENTCWVLPKTRGILDCYVFGLFGEKNMELCGLQEIGEITYELSLRNRDYLPLAENTSVSMQVNENISFDASGTRLYESDGLLVVMKDISVDEANGLNILLLVQNKRDQAVVFGAASDEFTLNGETTDVNIPKIKLEPGQCGVTICEKYDLTETDIDKPEDVTAFTVMTDVRDLENIYIGEALETAELSFTK